ncbi:invasion associated locus B family protein [Sedimentimonas flavescens]|uniref:Invasion associated locus B family protein n=1 Tax=Sedimentimonas flavescens TaxID=2851012 RepID=A0ABT2ZZR4_9RHOB|nr:invasion associated locus B family protein [Sedimentimonas flavescens]MBW0158478.1 invasion associated locus B family protein [Sedimentimonas flavescens]MCT2540978.1 invasion associated locus B family protein [Sedimentimonas flavescens]MCV2879163.1 invasion associated locus B family protein [Sedimentimonas flavescens]WBL32985.1 invasion associated locus B family protein [Sinirhodobacter sp. HNIBRBA609]
MKNSVLRGAAILSASVLFHGAAQAQATSNRVAANTDWSVFVEESPKECWGVSAPTETVNTKDGKKVEVRRGDILLFVTFRPGKPGEISFMGGYPFATDSKVEMSVNNGQKFSLFTSGEGAWAGSAEEDAKIIAALKGGADVTVTGRSGRGTQTQDKFSLMGFTAAMDEAAKRCK